MEYQLKRHGLELRFTAQKVQTGIDPQVEFNRPADYKIISPTEMNKLFEGLQ